MDRAKLVGNLTSKKADNTLISFSFLKGFGMNNHPCNTKVFIDIIWCPPPPNAGLIKCNIDGMAAGSPMLAANGGIFRDSQANHNINFCVALGEGSRF